MQAQHKYSNRLIHETSPYLLQHAHNPVDWYSWGEEALERARQEDKPILVSIGYAACHWCHVMERESFEDDATAQLMNEHFINIKIDREERPDLDHIYMDAVQAMTGSGGWPLNVFLTSEGKPFYGGTYFPPVKAFNRMSWKEVLQAIHQSYREKKNEILAQAENLTEHLSVSNSFGLSKQANVDSPFSKDYLDTIAANILKQADTQWGGFGRAPKFPQTFSIQYLLRHYHFTKDESALRQALLSLDKMICGGINDQLGGGFARYSTDNEWLAPHFEKMLYDNALLICVLSEAFQLTGNNLYKDAIISTMDFIKREMTNEEYGFYSSLDADSEGVEGKFYVWSKAEVENILGNDAGLFCGFYDITDKGNWEHTNILRMQHSTEEFANLVHIGIEELKEILEDCKQKLMQYRHKRTRPALDDKILLGWNALMNMACSKAYAALGDPVYLEMAIKNIQFIERRFKAIEGYYHTYKDNIAKIPAFLDDYACLIQSYIHLQEVTGDSDYLTKAKELTIFVIEYFSEVETGYFFYTHEQQKDVIIRKKEIYDGAVPSGNALMAANMLYLSIVFDDLAWRNRVKNITQLLRTTIVRYPSSFGIWTMVLQQISMGTKELAIVGKTATDVLPKLLAKFIPNRIIQASAIGNSQFPLLEGKGNPDRLEFYLCENYACGQPLFDIQEFLLRI